MMKRVLLIAAFALVLSAFVGFSSRTAQAQDDMMTHTCDSTLIALLYIAEHDYGFHAMSVDVSTFEKGQYAPLFDEMMAMMGEEAMGDDMMATEEAMMGSEETMMGDMVMLTPGHVEGEDPACTALRDELDAFLYTTLSEGMMMESGS
ncbi:MAG: hypothetical protein J0M07_10260 [Anaerolineae bacterium]|nr:hypothetical protein [Chloroflexota bacterium]MBN8635692.1 hypothetical protein [Anaerolineae bacterium]